MKVAIITHAFPPSLHANGKRPYYIAKGLLDAGCDVDVYTGMLGCITCQVQELESDRLRVVRVKDPVMNWLEFVKSCKWMHKLSVVITYGLIWPDFYAPWVKRVIKKIQKSDISYEKTIAFVFPSSIYLTQKMGLVDNRWIFDLQESVTPQYLKHPRRSPFQRMRQPKLQALESKALHSAGKTVFTADSNRQEYIKLGLVPADKTAHIPYFYDTDKFSELKNTVIPRKFEIRYFGTFDWSGMRSPKVFFKSLAKFLDKYPEAKNETKFVFYGNWYDAHQSLIEKYNLKNVVEINSGVPYEKYLELVCSAPILLLVVSPEHNLFMPSKIVDYIGSGRPVLSFLPEHSEMRKVAEKAKMVEYAAKQDDAEAGQDALTLLWERFNAGNLEEGSFCNEFWSSKTQINNYLKIIQTAS